LCKFHDFIVDWEAVDGVDKVPCPAGELFQGQDPGEDRVSGNATEADAGGFALCQVIPMIIQFALLISYVLFVLHTYTYATQFCLLFCD
jgi:hypothetical protein